MKHKAHWLAVGVLSGVAGFILSLPPAMPPSASPSGEHGEQQRLVEAYGQLPLYFIENQGQLDSQVSYYIQGRDKSIYFTPAGVTFALRGPDPEALEEESPVSRISYRAGSRWGRGASEVARRWVVKLDFVGANADVRPRGEEPTPAIVSYFKGPREEWKVGLPTYAGLIYEDLWPGIDLIYTGTVDRLKYTFLVKPGADPDQIRLAYRGAEVQLNEGGQLSTPLGGFQDDKPYVYQEDDGQREGVAAAYILKGEGGGEGQVYGFRVGAYNPGLPLVIDPAVLVYAGYIGGAGFDEGRGIAVDHSGNAYVTGLTSSLDFPTANALQPAFGGFQFDAFVAKLDPTGSALVYSTFLGGSRNDVCNAIAVDVVGNAYVTGQTFSIDFPTMNPLYPAGPGGIFGRDAFVAKLDATGSTLIYSTYLAGSGNDSGDAIAVDVGGNAYVAGVTTALDFPTVNAFQPTLRGFRDAFIAKLNPAGSALVYSTYLGGSDHFGLSENVGGIAVDVAGSAYVTGTTPSTDFPTANALQPVFGVPIDAFVAKLDPTGSQLVYSTYLGGGRTDRGYGIAVDALGQAYVTGLTSSFDFPTANALQSAFGGFQDAFVAKLDPTGSALVYSTYLGGSDSDSSHALTVDNAGNAYVTGTTESTEASFPVVVGPDLTFNGGLGDAFVAKVNPGGTALVYAGYIGGSSFDTGSGIAVDQAGNAYVTGSTGSTEASFPVTVGPDLTFNGSGDAFVAKIASPAPFIRSEGILNAASFLSGPFAPAAIVSLFGLDLASTTAQAEVIPLPTSLAGTTVTVTDSTGIEHQAPLFFVSAVQINCVIPPETAIGSANVTVTTADGKSSTASIQIEAVAPGLFAANATGKGVAAALFLRVAADGTRTQDLIFDLDTRSAVPINLGPEVDQLFLLLFGTGIRGFSSQITATVGGENVAVLGALPQGEFVGLDQVNIGPLPRSLAGRGEVDIILTADGKQANTVTVNIE